MICFLRPRTLRSVPIDVDPEVAEPEAVKARIRRITDPQTMATMYGPKG